MRQLLQTPIARIIAAGLALVVLLVAGGAVFLMQPSEEDRVAHAVRGVLAAFESQEPERFLETLGEPFDLDVGGHGRFTDRHDLHSRLTSAYAAIGYANLRPQRLSVHLLPSGLEAEVELTFHWTISRAMYPNAYSRSENRNPGGRPENALLFLTREDKESPWLLRQGRVELQQE